jgi:hypothetical protein
MKEKRASPRRRLRMIVNFEVAGWRTTGITHDVSRTGLFVRTIRIPRIGSMVTLNVHLAEGREIELSGKVMRSYSAPGTLRFVVPSGFGIRLGKNTDGYKAFVVELFG